MTGRSGAKDHKPHPRKWVVRNTHGILEVMLSDGLVVKLKFFHNNPNVATWETNVYVPLPKGDEA